MSHTIHDRSEIPNAPFYVLSNDSFMSGWGHAEGKTNTCVLPCESYEEAEIVAANARGRSDQRYVRIVMHKPRFRPGVLYSLFDKEKAEPWYTPGRWS